MLKFHFFILKWIIDNNDWLKYKFLWKKEINNNLSIAKKIIKNAQIDSSVFYSVFFLFHCPIFFHLFCSPQIRIIDKLLETDIHYMNGDI